MVQSHIQQPKQRIQELSRLIESYNQRYYEKNKPTISDVEFDALMAELIALEKQYPQFKLSDSPTQRVGTKVQGDLPVVQHQVKMMSLDNTYSKDELRQWEARVVKGLKSKSFDLVAEVKIDGVSCALTYENGNLVLAATRGDGMTGEDVTHNVKTIRNVSLKLTGKFPKVLEVRGEVYIDKNDFKAINEQRKKDGEELFANPRNTASGGLKVLDSRLAAKRQLKFFVHSFGRIEGASVKTHFDFLKAAKSFGLPVNPLNRLCKNIDDVIAFCDEFANKRESITYEIDGVVVKVNDLAQQEQLGTTLKSPRWAVAYKFAAYQATTVIKKITVQVGRTGVLTPVAELKPVACAGVMIARATLHNFDEIKRLNVNEGDRILLERAGDVIPKIVSVVDKLSSGIFPQPKVCPECGGKVVKEKHEDVAYRCVNPSCPKKIERTLVHFASRLAMDIEGLGEAVVVQLLEKGLVKDIADIYDLKKEDFLGLELFADKKAENLVKAIADSKKQPLSRFIYGLGIDNIGEKAAGVLAQKFGSIDAIMQISAEEMQNIDDVGPVMAQSVHDFFKSTRVKQLMKHFGKVGVGQVADAKRSTSGKLAGQKFVFTGELEGMTRDEAAQQVEQESGQVLSAVSRNVNFVVVGESPGSKYQQALKLGVKVINTQEFKELLNG